MQVGEEVTHMVGSMNTVTTLWWYACKQVGEGVVLYAGGGRGTETGAALKRYLVVDRGW